MAIKTFLSCAFFGLCLGAVFELSIFFRRSKILKGGFCFLFCLAAAGGFLVFSIALKLQSFRLYQGAGILAGVFLYEKSFHKILAFCAQKVYTVFKRKKKPKRKKTKICPEENRSQKRRREGSR